MPINVLDLTQQASQNKKNVTPKNLRPTVFHRELTGSGKGSIGLLCEDANPSNTDDPANSRNILHHPSKSVNGLTETCIIPCDFVPGDAYQKARYMPMPKEAVMIGTVKMANGQTWPLYFHMAVHDIKLISKSQPGGGKKTKTLDVMYRFSMFLQEDFSKPYKNKGIRRDMLANGAALFSKDLAMCTENEMFTYFSNLPKKTITQLSAFLKSQNGFTPGNDTIETYFDAFSLYESVSKCVDMIANHADETFHIFVNDSGVPDIDMVKMLRAMEHFSIPLDAYSKITADIKACVPGNNGTVIRDAVAMFRSNLNLMIMATLERLRAKKPQIAPIPKSPVPVGAPFSPEQAAAISTTEPLALVQSGAGTGKSTVILGRINYMKSAGINENDILVLSFTNAAADHIKDLNPNVKSMTIAAMVHTIYQHTFPAHALSTIPTLCNTLEITYKGTKNEDLVRQMTKLLMNIKSNDGASNQSFTHMMNLMEDRYADIIDMLSTVEQTTLELEIIICALNIQNFQIPADVEGKHIIIDEVQDNSIFEFIYLLNYVIYKNASLFMVGDCSQTLFEFRMSNPKALNSLESSGVFQTFRLDINYRSRQEILDFANIVLNDIEANQFAKIQLQSNLITNVTLQSFQDKVEFEYQHLAKKKEFEDGLAGILAREPAKYINKKLMAGEQVAFLAYARRTVKKMNEILEIMYPTAKIASLTPQVSYDVTFFSGYIRDRWNQVQFMPQRNILSVIKTELHFYYANQKGASQQKIDAADRAIAEFAQMYFPTVQQWEQLVRAGKMSQAECLAKIRTAMLDHEIAYNAKRHSVTAANNEERKANQDVKNANIVLSTIHSAKGLEFDNVVLIYDNKEDMPEDVKRLYYVALTRAKKSEHIIAYGTDPHPTIQENYLNMIRSLTPGYVSQDDTVTITP